MQIAFYRKICQCRYLVSGIMYYSFHEIGNQAGAVRNIGKAIKNVSKKAYLHNAGVVQKVSAYSAYIEEQ